MSKIETRLMWSKQDIRITKRVSSKAKTIERKQFLKWASKRTPGDYDKFNFEHLDADEQTAIKAEAGGAANGDKFAEFFRRRDEIRASRDAAVLQPPA